MTGLAELAALHCRTHKPALSLGGFSTEAYGVSRAQIHHIAAGKRSPSRKLLLRFCEAHARLFPGETVVVPLPDGAQAHLGPAGLSITFTQPTAQP